MSFIVIITLFQLPVPHFDNERRVFAVVDDPERQGLDALLGAAQLRQLLLQSRLGEGRHAAVCARFSPVNPNELRPSSGVPSSKL